MDTVFLLATARTWGTKIVPTHPGSLLALPLVKGERCGGRGATPICATLGKTITAQIVVDSDLDGFGAVRLVYTTYAKARLAAGLCVVIGRCPQQLQFGDGTSARHSPNQDIGRERPMSTGREYAGSSD